MALTPKLFIYMLFFITVFFCYVVADDMVDKDDEREHHQEEGTFWCGSFLENHPDKWSVIGENVTYNATYNDVNFYLFTQQNKLKGEKYKLDNVSQLANSKYFNKTRRTMFISHGWCNNHSSPVNTLTTAAVLKRFDYNVFVVGWAFPANKNYLTAAWAVSVIGECEGMFIKALIGNFSMDVVQFFLAGHSLGAHVAGAAGAVLKGEIPLIVGLDPAHPLFFLSRKTTRLNKSDARHVQVIHTSGLGFFAAIGHSDFYPDGGQYQEGCKDMFHCSHAKAYIYFATRIGDPALDKMFVGQRCANYSEYVKGSCKNNRKALMGAIDLNKMDCGDFYLTIKLGDLFD